MCVFIEDGRKIKVGGMCWAWPGWGQGSLVGIALLQLSLCLPIEKWWLPVVRSGVGSKFSSAESGRD